MPSAALAEAERSPWNADSVGDLASRLVEQAKQLEAELRAAEAAVQAKTADPDRAAGVGHRAVVIQDLTIIQSRAATYRGAVTSGQGREETRSLFGRIQALVSLTGSDMRQLPDYGTYRSGLGALEKTVASLGLFYAEKVEVHPPPDPLDMRGGAKR